MTCLHLIFSLTFGLNTATRSQGPRKRRDGKIGQLFQIGLRPFILAGAALDSRLLKPQALAVEAQEWAQEWAEEWKVPPIAVDSVLAPRHLKVCGCSLKQLSFIQITISSGFGTATPVVLRELPLVQIPDLIYTHEP